MEFKKTTACVDCFDFSPRFENVILSILPSTLFLLATPWRLFWLQRQKKRVKHSRLQFVKLISASAFTAIQIATLAYVSAVDNNKTPTSVAAAALLVLDAFAICVLSFLEHSKSIRPSSLLCAYLLITAIFDGAQIRTTWLRGESTLGALLASSLSIKIVVLFLEATEKKRLLDSQDKYSPENTSGLFNRGLFWWLNRLLKRGFQNLLGEQDLFAQATDMTSEHVHSHFSHAYRGKVPLAIFHVVKWQLPKLIASRLLLVAFTLCQPLLLHRLLEFLDNPLQDISIGYGLLGAYGLVYSGIAIATGSYYHSVYQCVTMTRGALVHAVYCQTTDIKNSTDDSKAVTLMTANVERITNTLKSIHELWANVVQLSIALWLLYLQVGIAFVVPIFVTLLSVLVIGWLANPAGKQQVTWVAAIEKRADLTAAVLSSIKAIKMSGLADFMKNVLAESRHAEIKAGSTFRWTIAWTATISFIPQLLSPPLTFAIFIAAHSASGLDLTRLFTSISLLLLITQPLASLFQTITPLVGALACCERIESFLASSLDFTTQHSIELAAISPDKSRMFHLVQASIGWKPEEPVLKDVNIEIHRSTINVIVGSVASGKSTLLKALLGEAKILSGVLSSTPARYAYCSQTPWLQSMSIRQIILGGKPFDPEWYATTIHATALEQDIKNLGQGEQTLIGSNGINLSGGQKQRLALARAVYARPEVLILDDVFAGIDNSTESLIVQRLFSGQGLLRHISATVVVSSHSASLLPLADHVFAVDLNGHVHNQKNISDLSNSYSDSPRKELDDPQPVSKPGQTDLTRQAGDHEAYAYYFKSIGWFAFSTFLILVTAFAFCMVFPSVWIQWWTTSAQTKTGMYLGIYTVFEVAAVASILSACVLTLVHIVAKSGSHLHQVILESVMNAPMRFFSSTDSGSILNRFTQDIGVIDAELPEALLDLVSMVLIAIGQAFLIARANYYILIAYPFLVGVIWTIQKFYLRTSRQLRHLELEAKAPLYGHFLETTSGIETIRAFGWQSRFKAQSLELLDASQKPYYLLFMVQRWLGLVLDLITMGIAVIVVGVAVHLRDSTSTGSVAVSLVNVISFTEYMRAIVILWTGTETSIGAIARIKSFATTTDSENIPGEDLVPASDWPQSGEIEFTEVSASYEPNTSAISHVSLSIKPGQKIGICGYSGSGKSSLMLSLFRMLELTTGTITVDGVDISHLHRSSVRGKLNCIPQEPFFLPGSVRFNIDLAGVKTDEMLIQVLRKVKLWDVLSETGLDGKMKEDLLSQGQKQLFCLARAMLKESKIVVLDEVTSSVDAETETFMQCLIREAFKDCTIIAIAHRLDTLLDFDLVVVMDGGEVVETGNPRDLLGRESKFADLYRGRMS